MDVNYVNLCVVADLGHRKLSGTVHISRGRLVFLNPHPPPLQPMLTSLQLDSLQLLVHEFIFLVCVVSGKRSPHENKNRETVP